MRQVTSCENSQAKTPSKKITSLCPRSPGSLTSYSDYPEWPIRSNPNMGSGFRHDSTVVARRKWGEFNLSNSKWKIDAYVCSIWLKNQLLDIPLVWIYHISAHPIYSCTLNSVWMETHNRLFFFFFFFTNVNKQMWSEVFIFILWRSFEFPFANKVLPQFFVFISAGFHWNLEVVFARQTSHGSGHGTWTRSNASVKDSYKQLLLELDTAHEPINNLTRRWIIVIQSIFMWSEGITDRKFPQRKIAVKGFVDCR